MKQLKQATIAMLIALLMVISPLWNGVAQADDLGFVAAAQQFAKTVTDARSVFSDLSKEANGLLDGLDDIQGLLKGLPDELTQIGSAPDVAAKTALQKQLTTKQEALKTFTQSFSNWITKAEAADKQYEKTVDTAEAEFKKAFKASQSDLKTQTHDSVASLKQTFKQTSKLISSLADSTTKAASGKGTFLPAQYDEQLATLSKAFADVKAAIAALQ